MTGKQLQEQSISLANTMMGLGYSQSTIEATLASLKALLSEQVPTAVSRYQDLLKQTLPEREFYSKMSQVYKELVSVGG